MVHRESSPHGQPGKLAEASVFQKLRRFKIWDLDSNYSWSTFEFLLQSLAPLGKWRQSIKPRDWEGPQCAFENKKIQLRVRRNIFSCGYLSPSRVPFRMWIDYQSKHRWFIFAITQWTNQIHLQNGPIRSLMLNSPIFQNWPIKSHRQSMWMNFKNWK